MNYNDEQKKKHILTLQNALYKMGLQDTTLPRVYPNGVFGPETTECVRELQRRHSMPDTGSVNKETWDMIFAALEKQEKENSEPLPIAPFPTGPLHIEKGITDSGIGMAQVMLWELSKHYDNIKAVPVTLQYDDATNKQVRQVQRLSGLKESDVLDCPTWNALTELYNMFRK